jgi:hypothetical protein
LQVGEHCSHLMVSPVAAACRRSSLHDRFVSALQQQRPQVLEALAATQAAAAQQREAEHRLCQLFKQPTQQQRQQPAGAAAAAEQPDGVTAAAPAPAAGTSGFCFGFQVAGSEDGVSQQDMHQPTSGGGFSFGFDVPAAAASNESDHQPQHGNGSAAEGTAQQEQLQEGSGKGKRGRQQKAARAPGNPDYAAAAAGEVVKKPKRVGGKQQH